MYLNLHEERKKLVEPVELPWEQQLEQWNAKEYKQKEFQEGTAVILTEKGERVRSKSEKILADYFYRNGIPYKYEKPLYLKGLGIVHPDFTFLSGKTKQEIYWEHDGEWMMGYMCKMQFVKSMHTKRTGFTPVRI